MPFLDNSSMRGLFDIVNGGPPEAWKCLLLTDNGLKQCGRICKTLAGIIAHQRMVHNYTPQMEMLTETVPLTKPEVKPDNN